MSAAVSQTTTERPEVEDAFTAQPTGLLPNVPSAEYHTRVLGVASKSALDLVHRSPAHYKAWVDGAVPDEESPTLAFGAAFHCALLEPEKYAATYAVEPDFGDCRFKENKARRDEWRRANAGKTLISEEDAEAIRGMVASVHAHPLAGKMIRDGVPELTVRWVDEETGLRCKARLDYYVERLRMVVDVKSTADASHDAFRKSVANYGYHRQDAFYRAGMDAVGKPIDHFVFVAVEKVAPYAVGIFSLDAESVAKGYDSIRHDMATLAECLRTNRWPGYPETIQTLTLPPWAT